MDLSTLLTGKVILYILSSIGIFMIIFDYIKEVIGYKSSLFKVFKNKPLSIYEVFFGIIGIIILDTILIEYIW